MGKAIILSGGSRAQDLTARKENVLVGKTYVGADADLDPGTGIMPDRGAVNASLNCGESYTIPAGHHNEGSVIRANALSRQTPASASAGQVINGYSGWVNGEKIQGSVADRGNLQNGGYGAAGNYIAINAIPEGWYHGSPRVQIPTANLMSALGITADKLKKGITIGNVTGSWEGWVDPTCTIYDNGTWGGGAAGLSSGAMGGVGSTYPVITPDIKFTDYKTLHVQVYVGISYTGDDWWEESDIDGFYVWDANKNSWGYMGHFGPNAHQAGTFYNELTYDISGWDFRGTLKFENRSSKMSAGNSVAGPTGISKIWMTK